MKNLAPILEQAEYTFSKRKEVAGKTTHAESNV